MFLYAFLLQKKLRSKPKMKKGLYKMYKPFLSWKSDSNRRPLHYEWSALPTELFQHDLKFKPKLVYLIYAENSTVFSKKEDLKVRRKSFEIESWKMKQHGENCWLRQRQTDSIIVLYQRRKTLEDISFIGSSYRNPVV